jgi:signal peptidase I
MVPSGSMIPTIQEADYVFTIKSLHRLHSPEFYPLSSIPFPFFSKPGLLPVNKGSILVFASPISYNLHPSLRMRFVKRVVGMPGDTVNIYNNGAVKSGQWMYIPDQHNGMLKEKISYQANVNIDTSFIVPFKGMLINLQQEQKKSWMVNVQRDRRLYAKNGPYTPFDSLFTYTFQQNHYFVIGDNMLAASDSRKWGCFPEELILGYVLFRYRPNPFNNPAFSVIH